MEANCNSLQQKESTVFNKLDRKVKAVMVHLH